MSRETQNWALAGSAPAPDWMEEPRRGSVRAQAGDADEGRGFQGRNFLVLRLWLIINLLKEHTADGPLPKRPGLGVECGAVGRRACSSAVLYSAH